jgi:signal peptidase I
MTAKRPGVQSLGRFAAVMVVAAAAVVAWLAWPSSLGGHTSYVSTRGVSMEPRFHTGDLAVLTPVANYKVGDVVAYHDPLLHTVVMHRIVAFSDGRYTFKGDNNTWLDATRPTQSQLIGKLSVRVPQGGVWLNRLSNPITLAVLVFLLVVSGGSTVARRRTRRRGQMSRHAAPRGALSNTMTALPPGLRTAAGATAALGLLALGLGGLAWTRSLDAVSTTTTTPSRSMTFAYGATVAKTAAYDGTIVAAPDPIFRRLTNDVDVHFDYRGAPGRLAVDAEVSAPSGWHTTMPLSSATSVTDRYQTDVTLDLDAIDQRAQNAARVIGLPVTQLAVSVVAHISDAAGTPFDPSLKFALTPSQLSLARPDQSLTVSDTTTVTRHRSVHRMLSLAGHSITVALARKVSAAALLLALLLAGLIGFVSRRSSAGSEGARIRRRYAPLLLPVAPMPTPAGRPVVDVTEFKTLVRLAERYDLLVLHWTRSGIDTFVVQDDATTFRYRTGSGETWPDTAAVPHAAVVGGAHDHR